MGQEASLPQDPDAIQASLEEQAKAPPSTYNINNSVAAAAATTGRSGRKLIGSRFRGQQQQQQQQHHHHHHQQQDVYEGNGDSSSYPVSGDAGGGGHSNLLLQDDGAAVSDPDQLLQQKTESQAAASAQYAYDTQQQSSTTTDGGSDGDGEPPIVGIMYEKQPSSPRRGLFSSKMPSGRGAAIINSMRNLSLGGALRSNKQHRAEKANDWEKQWDEDIDEDEEEEEVLDDQDDLAITALQQQQHQLDSRMPPDASGSLPLHHHHYHHQQQKQHHQLQPDGLLAQQLASPSAALPQQQEQQQQQDLLSMEHSVGATNVVVSANKPLQFQQVDDDGLEWDTAAPKSEEEGKPNVQMFMPMLRVLGKGSFGKVVLVQKRIGKERGQLFAMKILRKTHLVKRRQIERTRTERKVLSLVNHPFIMKLHYAFQSDDKLYLVLDYCPGGELFFHLSRFRRFPERVARFYAAELLLAIGHLHKRGIIYRDLKPENVLLDADGHVKLGDFGLAKAGITHALEGAMSMCGTPEYMAPEVLAQQGHGFCVDYWGLGMILYEMMTGLPPWYTTDRTKLFRKLKSAPLDIPSYFSVHSANCVSALLERDPRRRLGVTGIRAAMEHEFFRNISWRSLYARKVEAPIRPCEGWSAPEAIGNGESGNGIPNPVSADFVDFADIERMNSNDLEAATQNFDNQFTRMPVESVDSASHLSPEDAAAKQELNENTFRGFSFDGHYRDHSSLSTSSNAPSPMASRNASAQPAYPAQNHHLD